MVLLALYKVH